MQENWINTRVMECSAVNGDRYTVIEQGDGTQPRYVLGNGREVARNGDGSFTVPGTEAVLWITAL
ncbi:MHC class I heavy chain [Salipiger manganoxidans]|uniref:MHC class I heavy chain n=1 Tax=Salipiger marinus TaxID=555512 RepID=UPI001E636069|nr:MHC class I heavy chain [Salipiger manganoxidans]MCD1621084.1 MHC class I heavy chain [Salipiger manganoxidans]